MTPFEKLMARLNHAQQPMGCPACEGVLTVVNPGAAGWRTSRVTILCCTECRKAWELQQRMVAFSDVLNTEKQRRRRARTA